MRYKIIPAKYELSEKLGKEVVNVVPSVYHVEIFRDKKRTAFLTRSTYEAAKADAEKYMNTGV